MLEFVSQVGVASARQLERLAFPKSEHGSGATAARRARRSLQRLSDKGLLDRLERRVGGVRAGSSSYLYQLGTKGRRRLGQSGRGRTWEPSHRFIDHCLAAAEVHVGLIEAQRLGQLTMLEVTHEPGTWRRFAGPHGAPLQLKPDLLVECDLPSGWCLRWFVEIDRATEHLPTVLAKCLLYERYWHSGAETVRHEIFPRVLWSVPSATRAERIRAAIDADARVSRELFAVATSAQTVAVLSSETNQQEGGEP